MSFGESLCKGTSKPGTCTDDDCYSTHVGWTSESGSLVRKLRKSGSRRASSLWSPRMGREFRRNMRSSAVMDPDDRSSIRDE